MPATLSRTVLGLKEGEGGHGGRRGTARGQQTWLGEWAAGQVQNGPRPARKACLVTFGRPGKY